MLIVKPNEDTHLECIGNAVVKLVLKFFGYSLVVFFLYGKEKGTQI